jgi:uncharacterized protein (TIGR03437 family)
MLITYFSAATALALALPALGLSGTSERWSTTYKRLFYFEQNQGQAAPDVRFLARNGRTTIRFTESEILFQASPPAASTRTADVRMRFAKSNPRSRVEGLEPLPGISNYFVGNDPHQWQVRVRHFAKICYRDIYPGIDLIFHENAGAIEYDLVLAPGARAETVDVRFDGAEDVRVARNGDLEVEAGGLKIRNSRPIVYQAVDRSGREIGADFVIRARRAVGIRMDPYNPEIPVVIDPTITFSTNLGGSSSEEAHDVAIDSVGNVYVTGWTYSTNFPTAAPFQTAHSSPGERNAFIVKLSPEGKLLYSTYLGGRLGTGIARNIGRGIAVDAQGNAYVTGETYSDSFPVTAGAFQTKYNEWAGDDGFITKLSPTGDRLVYSTYVAASGQDLIEDIAVDAFGSAYITGRYIPSRSVPADWPTTPGAFRTTACGGDYGDSFVLKLNPEGTALGYGTMLCGTLNDHGRGIAVDSTGAAYVAGMVVSTDFPIMNAAQPLKKYAADAFVAKLSPSGTALVYSTFLGGSGLETAIGIAVDSAGAAYVTGETDSSDFPNVGGFQPWKAKKDAFVAKLSPSGSTLLYSTCLGGSQDDTGRGIAVDNAGNAYITGASTSSNFPAIDPVQKYGGKRDMFVVKLNPATSGLVYSTWIGGSDNENFLEDSVGGIAVDGNGAVWVVGETSSPNFPTVNPLQAPVTSTEESDVVILKLVEGATLANVSASSYRGGELAPGSIASAFGSGLANSTAVATTLPLPTSLSGAQVRIRDSAGAERLAPLFFVSSGQINYLIPADTALGLAVITADTPGGASISGTVRIAQVAPGLFTANTSGDGVAAASVLRVKGDGSQIVEALAHWDSGQGRFVPAPIDVGSITDQVFLILYGTGIRGVSSLADVSAKIGGVAAEVLYGGVQPEYVGLDQVNVRLPRSLAGRGAVTVEVSVSGKPCNPVVVAVR